MGEATIAAISTASGPAGVGIIRISGPEAAQIATQVFQSKSGKKLAEQPTYRIIYGHILDETRQLIDEALALTMWSPGSFTGEDVVELQCHGGSLILQKVLALVLKAGARLARPGEFSQRAFLNGRLDLAQAEAIMDLIQAKTEEAANLAFRHLQGEFSAEIEQCQQAVLELVATLEAELDFPEEDLPHYSSLEIEQRLQEIAVLLKKRLASFQKGRIMREGLKVALIGQPNVGKSSLLNTFLKTKRAIVTEIPGTTRDSIEEYYNLGGLPLLLTDTAGIRETCDPVEKMGVQKTKEIIEQADLLLYILDLKWGLTDEDKAFIKQLPREKVLLVGNKVDLLKEGTEIPEQMIRSQLSNYRLLLISATEKIGLQELEEEIKKMFWGGPELSREKVFLTNLRHKIALEKALNALTDVLKGLEQGLPTDFLVIDLKNCLEFLGEISGETIDEAVLTQIFAQFCLGK